MAVEGRGALVGQRLGGYQLISLLGMGGMAEVYLAREVSLRREVAVKVLPATLAADPEYVKRFKNEAKQVAALNHPHIVPVYYFDEDRGLLYLVMPVLKGSLRELLDHERVLPATHAVELTIQIASGLHAAHRLGLVHRDVKPENILLNAAGKALLSDFGIARQVTFARQEGVAQTLAATGLPVGTPEYMAPEQLRGGSVDQRADIYALGAVLYELLTGVVPHDAASPYEVAALVLTEPISPPSRRNPMIGPALEEVVMCALDKDPDARYHDAEQFAAALGQAMRADAAAPRGGKRTVAAIGAPRTTRRFSHPSLFPPVAGGLPDVPTEPTMRAVDTHARTAIPPAAVTSAERYRGAAGPRSRWLALGAALMLLIATACGFGAVHLLGGAGATTGRTGDGLTPPTHTPIPSASGTHNVGGSGFPTQPAATGTVGVIGQSSPTPFGTPTVTPSPSPTKSPTPTPTATPVPPPLSFSPLPLTPNNKNCSGLQYITNNGSGPVTWAWQQSQQVAGYSYKFSQYASWISGWPHDSPPGIASGQIETLYVKASLSACSKLPMQVTVMDSANHSYQIEVTRG